MSEALKIIFFAIIVILVMVITIIPKLLSMLWYWEKFNSFKREGNTYWDLVAEIGANIFGDRG